MAPRKKKAAESEELDSESDASISEEESGSEDVSMDESEDSDDSGKKKKAAPKKAPAVKKAAAPPAKAASAKKAAAPPKKKAKTEDAFIVSDDEDSDEEGPVKKKPAPKKAAPKKKAKEEEDSDEEGPVMKVTKKAAPKPKGAAPETLDNGWRTNGSSLLYKDYGAKTSAKIAAFDFDGTLVTTKSGAKFATSENDWKLYNGEVAEKLKGYEADGYRIVVFTNQGGVKSALDGKMSANVRGRLDHALKHIGVTPVVLAATMSDNFRKPSTGMWDFYCEKLAGGVAPDISASFFVGDSIDGGDQGFANGVGLAYRTEKEEFGEGVAAPASQPGKPSEGSAVDSCKVPGNVRFIEAFETLAREALESAAPEDKVKAGFKARAFTNSAKVVAEETVAITLDNYKKGIAKQKGIGKGSLSIIEAVLKGEPLKKEVPEDKVKKEAAPKSSEALLFM